MYIDCESAYSASSAVKQASETLRKKLIQYLCFIWFSVDFIHSWHYMIIVSKRVTLSWRKTDFGQSIWPAGDQLTTAFTILNSLEYEFLKGFLVQGRQQSFWKFSVLSNTLDRASDFFRVYVSPIIHVISCCYFSVKSRVDIATFTTSLRRFKNKRGLCYSGRHDFRWLD